MDTDNSNEGNSVPANGEELSAIAINEENSASANSPWKPAPDDGSNPSQPAEVKEEHVAESRKRSRFDIPPDSVKSFGFDLKAAVEEAKRLKMGNGVKKEEEKKDEKKKKEKEGPVHKQSKLLPDLEKHWKTVDENPRDFNAWTTLLQCVDQENDLEVAREAYDSFLARYPYCYGYWKKYADYEKKKAHKKDCEQVFERGLAAIPLSVDLWLHYLNYCRVHHAAREDYVRQQFERAVDTCGLEFRSDRIWELYINWEVERDDLGRVFRIYDRLLKIPTQFHSTHFDNFEDLVTQNDPKELLTTEEYETIKQEVLRRRQEKDEDSDAKKDKDGDEDEKLSDEEVNKMKEIIKTMRRATHRKTEAAITERWTFEEAIKRPYFHVKALERGQLKNWRTYTDFEISKGNKERIVILFERCLIACALYEEFWLKYVNYLETLPKSEETQTRIRDVFRRACTIHLQDKPNIHLHWAAYEEKTGNVSVASEILEQLEKKHPDLGIVPVRRIHVLRRGHFGHPAVLALFSSYLDKDKEELPSDVRTDIAVRASRYAAKVLGDMSMASQFLFKGLEKDPSSARLHMQLLDLEYQKQPMDLDAVVEALDRGILAPLDAAERYRFAQRKVEFLEEFGTSLDVVWTAQEELAQLKKSADEARASKLAADGKTEEGPETKKAKIEDKTVATGAGAVADAATSAAAVPYDQSQYGQYYQQYGQWGYGGQGYQQNWQGYYPQQQY